MRVLEIAYSYGATVYFYRSCQEAAQVLKEEADGLLAWQHPKLPEDLCFLDDSGKDWLINIAHEEIMTLNMDEEEGKALSEQVNGLFLQGEFNAELDAFLNDAIRHNAEKLYLSGYDLDHVPEKISRVTSLKSLTIFEGRIRRLPESLFELEQLEELIVYTADLLPLPKEIGRLHRLKRLQISCCSYYRWGEGEPLPAKETGSFRELPDEIGQLSQLEHLTINATPLSRLPSSIVNLKRLSFVDLSNNLFESRPIELSKLPSLQHVMFYQNPVEP
ncbi:leucine-rich repeat domain-containing protein [Paenibacillus sp. OAS669]|uniref:leucine-rich repeat domain-containing protein n=1 Tax=Paenibacillus sp. OAS669 TaxID=2663821 RepID=UPI00178A4065|nr:leucine-rich repeat domain-containing protein [Paenibacillus sp. OAS669]MBE1443717.1 Leucine-rich repeat (LRR) protein [Paenibacillus sp. OAS669]